MKSIPCPVTASDGEKRDALIIVCENCDNDTFAIFLVDGKHQHLQCAACGTTFCDGSCEKEKEHETNP